MAACATDEMLICGVRILNTNRTARLEQGLGHKRTRNTKKDGRGELFSEVEVILDREENPMISPLCNVSVGFRCQRR
jgi:hypothetical protein